MLRFAILSFYRSVARHRLYAALNIGGLALGIAVVLVLGLYVRFETGFDHWLPHHDEIYLVEGSMAGSTGTSRSTPAVLWDVTRREMPDAVGTRIYSPAATVVRDGVGTPEKLALVDPSFFKVFSLPVVAGNAAAALRDPTNIILTQRTARKYFGTSDPIGHALNVGSNGSTRSYRVAAVLADLPRDTDLEFDLVARIVVPSVDPGTSQNGFAQDATFFHWNYFDPQTYVRLPNAGATSAFGAAVNDLAARYSSVDFPQSSKGGVRLKLQPLGKVHFEKAGLATTVTTLGVVGILAMIIAIVNYVNLATARAGLRAREVAMRKVLGADRTTLLFHFIGEAVATTAIAAVFGLAFAEVGVPLVNAAGGLDLQLHYFGPGGVLAPLALLSVVVGAIAGTYPALVLSRYPAAAVLAAAKTPGGGHAGVIVREGLVVVQFALAIAFMIGTGVLFAQTQHVRNADLGFSREGLIVVRSLANASLDAAQRDTLVNRFRGMPGVSAVTIADGAPGGTSFNASGSIAVPGTAGDGPDFQFMYTGPGYFDLLGIPLLAGRVFDLAHPGDISREDAPDDATRYAVINKAGATALHFPTPAAAVGKTVGIRPAITIVGVVDDVRFYSPREAIRPTYYMLREREVPAEIALVRFHGNPAPVLDTIRQVWRQTAPQVPLDAKTAAQSLNPFYEADEHAAQIFAIGAGLAVLIGCIGLWGLASFNTARRVKEIGIRKTLGASSADIVKLLVGQFLKPVIIANLFAWPLAYFAVRTWLAGFDDRIALSPLFFIGATGLALLIAVGTVITQSLRASRAAPAWALRHE